MEKVILLDGLGCANCANKMENNIKDLKGIEDVSIDFVHRKLSFSLKDINNYPNIIEDVKKIVKQIEPHVEVREEVKKRVKNKVEIKMLGLHCASCANKFEDGVKKIEGIKDCYLDFANNILIIYVNSIEELPRITDEAVQIIKKYEPHLVLEIMKDDNETEDKGAQDFTTKRKLIKLGVGTIFFAIALLFNFALPIKLSIFLLSYFLIGGDVLTKAIKNILRGQIFDENFLMTIATIGAFLVGEYPEAVAVMLFYQIGEAFQDSAVNKSRRSIKALMDIKPDYANMIINGQAVQVDPEDVRPGDVILVKPGERVPLDGKVVEGSTMVDTAALTGESVPRKVEVGEELLSGYINRTGLVKVKITKEFSESTVSRIIELVQSAASRKAPTEKFITKFARYYTPVVVFLALGLALIPPLVLEGEIFSDWVYRALIFLVISCPCALVVSIPLGFFGGIGAASRNGVLIKGGNYLEALDSVSTIVFDKTGTLTKGVFKVKDIKPTESFTRGELIGYAALAEAHSNHPIAKSILENYGKKIDLNLVEDYEEIPGLGVKVKYQGKEILAGNQKLLARENIMLDNTLQMGTIVYIAVDKVYAGSILISDEIKEDAQETIKNLRKMGINKLVILTGDNINTGEHVAKELGIDQVYTQLMPEDKVMILEGLMNKANKGEKIIFVGDGINDAPVLARADIGVAMGGLGSDAAIEAADVVLMTDEPSKLVTAIKIAKRTKAIVWQNIILALGVKGFVLSLGAVGIATMWGAVFADVGVALIAVLNAIRVIKVKL